MASDLSALDAWSERTGLPYTIHGRRKGEVHVTLPPASPRALHVGGSGATLEEAAVQALRLWEGENLETVWKEGGDGE